MKRPSFQFYPADWRKDPGVQALNFHDRGVWFEMLCLMHESQQRGKLTLNGRPMPEEALARLLGLDKQNLTRALSTLSDFGVSAVCPESGAIMSKRMVRDEALTEIRRNAGKLGGNPSLLNQTANQKPTTPVNQNPTPSSSSSSSSPKSKKEESLTLPFLSRDFARAWEDWEKYRKERKQKLTPSTIQATFKKFQEWGEAKSVAAIEASISAGWQGIFEPKIDPTLKPREGSLSRNFSSKDVGI